MGPIGCPETSVKDYHSTLRNIPEECRSYEHRGGSLKSRVCFALAQGYQHAAREPLAALCHLNSFNNTV
jgi:hypothetical protein